MSVNAWLEQQSLRMQALVGALAVAVISFGLNYSSEPTAAAVAAVISGVVIGGAYYLGLRVFSE